LNSHDRKVVDQVRLITASAEGAALKTIP